MEYCKECGNGVKVKEVVREVEKRVEVGENALLLRTFRGIGAVMILIGILITGYNVHLSNLEADERSLEAEELKALLGDPSIKIEIQEAYRAPDIRKFSR